MSSQLLLDELKRHCETILENGSAAECSQAAWFVPMGGVPFVEDDKKGFQFTPTPKIVEGGVKKVEHAQQRILQIFEKLGPAISEVEQKLYGVTQALISEGYDSDLGPGEGDQSADKPKNALTEQLERSEAARHDLEQQLVAVVQSQHMLISLGGELSPLEYNIVKYLWDCRSASLEDIHRDCWDKPVQPDSQTKAIKRLANELTELNKGVFIGTKNGIVTLTRPDK